MKKKLFEFLDTHNFTPEQVENLNFILDKISDFESINKIELEEEQAINWSMDYSVHYKKNIKIN